MTAIFLAWDPEQRTGWTYPTAVEQIAQTGRFLATWILAGHHAVPSDTEVWLLLHGRHGTGLLGHGVVVSEPPEKSLATGPAAAPAPVQSVRVALDALLPLGDHIGPGLLDAAVSGLVWEKFAAYGIAEDRTAEDRLAGESLRSSVQAVYPADEPGLRRLWAGSGPRPGPDPTRPVPGTLPPETVARVEVNRYEHDENARRICIARHGTRCAVCGFDFEASYGEIGSDFIDVHHLVPPSDLGNGYELDPVTDLVPLCANCHAMAHRGVSVPRTVAELQRIVAAAGFLPGDTVGPDELRAQQDARRILEQR